LQLNSHQNRDRERARGNWLMGNKMKQKYK